MMMTVVQVHVQALCHSSLSEKLASIFTLNYSHTLKYLPRHTLSKDCFRLC